MEVPVSPARLLQCLVALSLLLPIPALAQPALTTQRVNMRAGPDAAFPLVAWFPASTEVFLVGCTVDERWCDVVSGRRRGWIYARYLSIRPRNQLPTVTFSVEEYWNAHYRSQRWFADKPLWVDWGTPSFQPPPPKGP
jgi:uncharacterized protein YraI